LAAELRDRVGLSRVDLGKKSQDTLIEESGGFEVG
jgi:hypothetical protein